MKKIIAVFLLIFMALPLVGDRIFDVGLKGMIPVNPVLIFSSPGAGLEFDFLMLDPLILGFEYYYTGQQFYYYDHDTNTWSSATGWSSNHADGSSQSDWIFSQFRHVILLNALLGLGEGDITFRTGVGAAFVFYAPSDAWTYYPEFQESFSEFASSQNVSVGFNIKGALDYSLTPYLQLMLEANYLIDQPLGFFANVQRDGANYLINMAHLSFGIRYVFEDAGKDSEEEIPVFEDEGSTDTESEFYYDEIDETDSAFGEGDIYE